MSGLTTLPATKIRNGMETKRHAPSALANFRFFLGPYWTTIVGILALQLFSAAVMAVSVGSVAPVVGEVLGLTASTDQGAAVAAITAVIDWLPFQDRFISVLVFFLGTTALAHWFTFQVDTMMNHLRNQATGKWTDRLYRTIVHAEYPFFLDTHQGNLVHLIMVSAYKIGNLFDVLTVLMMILQVLAIVGLLLSVSPTLTLGVVGVGGSAYFGLTWFSRRLLQRLGEARVRATLAQTATANEAIAGFRFLQVFDVVTRWRREFRAVSAAYARATVGQEAAQRLPGVGVGIGLLLIFGIGVFLTRGVSGQDFVGYLPTLTVFAQAFLQLLRLVSTSGIAVTGPVASLPYTQQVMLALQQPHADLPDGNRTFHQLEQWIRFDHVSFTHRGRESTLNDVSFSLERGTVTALVGRSGAGKSTVVDLLLRLMDADTGAIRVDGVDLRELAIDSWRQAIGVVSQEAFVFNATIAENIALGKPDATRGEIVAAARRAGAQAFIAGTPNGYDTLVGDRGMTLSGGQRQRIVLARALIRQPQLLILDEATSTLDSETERAILATLRSLRGNCTQLVIAHRLSTVRDADAIIVMEGGRVVEIGTHEELMQQHGTYYELVQRQTLDPSASHGMIASSEE